MIKWIGILFLLLGLPTMVEAGAIRIESESLIVEHEHNRAEFKGSVHLTRDDFELRCDRLLAFYRQQAGGELERAEAYGHVTMKQKDKHGSSNKAVYNQSSGILILLGNAIVVDPEGNVRGEKIIHNVRTLETKVQQGSKGERVHLTFDDEEDDNKPATKEKLP